MPVAVIPRRPSLQEIPEDRQKKIYALLIAIADKSRKNQRTLGLRSPIQEFRDTQIPFTYIGFGGQYLTHSFGNTCVLDSLLAGLNIAASVHPNIRELFMEDNTIDAVMTLLDSGKYAEAKALWLINLDFRLGRKKYFTERDYIDIRGYVKDHLPNLLDLTSAKFHYDDERRSPNPEDVVYMKTVSKFEDFGDVRVLGSRGNPELILVDVDSRMDKFPPVMITDDYERDFRLQFLLLGIITANSNHMVLCTSLDVGWWLYDAMEPSLFRNVNLEDIQTQGYVVNLAAYVKVPANNEKQD
ncbi:uncharacterized protein LOC133128805 isoform X1 [Conger conger]|uniref:uncharacterized protein LOC133128805 isoform X1 n=1 Tax=Conger conger TaxID=82655 RepID=UPI002A59D716|nr:uncharacterized protein LOC133128805 isoform X1 [Conger conger]